MSWSRITKASSLTAAATGLGAGISAAIRGGDIIESSSIVGVGSGLFMAGVGTAGKLGFFGPINPQPVDSYLHVVGPAFIELIGTSIGYFGANLFLNVAVSTSPFADAAFGLPITVGVMFLGKQLLDYYDQIQNAQNTDLRSHAL